MTDLFKDMQKGKKSGPFYWPKYLEGAQHTIEVLCDYNNLKYFIITKALTRR
jgi:hypothetical protein